MASESTTPSTDAAATNLVYRPVYKHWFYKTSTTDAKSAWYPFSMADSLNLECGLSDTTTPIVTTNGGRHDVNIAERTRYPVYWNGQTDEVRRCSWFYKGLDSHFVPYEEDVADRIEEEFRIGTVTGEWNRKLPLANGETIAFHSSSVIVHFLQPQSMDNWTTNAVPVTLNCVIILEQYSIGIFFFLLPFHSKQQIVREWSNVVLMNSILTMVNLIRLII